MTSSVSSVVETMPPTIGSAMRRMTSEPRPSVKKIGSRPAMMVSTVISFGRTRITAPAMIASLQLFERSRRLLAHLLVDVEQHDDGRLDRNAAERDEADGNRDRQVVAREIDGPQAADEAERQRHHDDERPVEPAEVQHQQDEDDQPRRPGSAIASRSRASISCSNWPDQADRVARRQA